jgi:hypothetical protein
MSKRKYPKGFDKAIKISSKYASVSMPCHGIKMSPLCGHDCNKCKLSRYKEDGTLRNKEYEINKHIEKIRGRNGSSNKLSN